MSEPRSFMPLPNSSPRRLRHGVTLPRAGLLLAASAMVCLLIAACSTAAASPEPVRKGPVAAAPVSVDYAPLPVSSPTSSALTTASSIPVAATPLEVAAPDGFVGRPSPQGRTAEPPNAVAFGGRNRFAIPTLGINSTVGTTSCGKLIPNGIWYWPCAGKNNLYLMGHAWGVFAPIHDGYHSGMLTAGLAALYSDGAGVVHRYRLLWVEDLPVAVWGKGATWASTGGSVITLQTCDGATDSYRIIVRFVPA